MNKTNKKTLVAGIVICAVSSAASASNNSITSNELSVNEISFVNAEPTTLKQTEDSLLLKKELLPSESLNLAGGGGGAGGGIRDGKTRFVPDGKSKGSFWDWIFS